MDIRPSKKVVICESVETKTHTGILIVTGDEKKPELGKVLAIGEGNKPLEFNVGDTIVFRRYTENLIVIQGKEYNFIIFKDILEVMPN